MATPSDPYHVNLCMLSYSQLTPGPIAVIATGLFLPSILLMFILFRYYQKVRHLQPVKHFSSGVNPAVVGRVLSATINLLPAIVPVEQLLRIGINIILFGVALFLIGKLKWHPALDLRIGAMAGMVVGFVTGLA